MDCLMSGIYVAVDKGVLAVEEEGRGYRVRGRGR